MSGSPAAKAAPCWANSSKTEVFPLIQLLLAVIYLAFISLGLPDSLLGTAWPVMYVDLGVAVSASGAVSMIISLGTIFSSLQSYRFTHRFGTGKVTAVSTSLTALALLGFSCSRSFWALCLFAIPYGLGAGSIDASLNNYVATHYASRHMSWLHCMWGLGASISPYIMSAALTGRGWPSGYRTVGIIQLCLTVLLFAALPLWNKRQSGGVQEKTVEDKPLTLKQIFSIPGVTALIITFFCYCALETTVFFWSASWMVLQRGYAEEQAASLAGLLFIGMTVGRAISGFVTMKLNDRQMIRLGSALIVLGLVVTALPLGTPTLFAGLLLIGLGCAPIYPCIIHCTPTLFGADRSQAIIGVQMAAAYTGSLLMSPLFGVIADFISPALFLPYLALFLVLMLVMHSTLLKQTQTQ